MLLLIIISYTEPTKMKSCVIGQRLSFSYWTHIYNKQLRMPRSSRVAVFWFFVHVLVFHTVNVGGQREIARDTRVASISGATFVFWDEILCKFQSFGGLIDGRMRWWCHCSAITPRIRWKMIAAIYRWMCHMRTTILSSSLQFSAIDFQLLIVVISIWKSTWFTRKEKNLFALVVRLAIDLVVKQQVFHGGELRQ